MLRKITDNIRIWKNNVRKNILELDEIIDCIEYVEIEYDELELEYEGDRRKIKNPEVLRILEELHYLRQEEISLQKKLDSYEYEITRRFDSCKEVCAG